ncbi:MAG: iron-sulfur cluster assembly scaffold protein [Syntrophaceae bacterium]|nr:iron-sulfur cluster assembly scaffold protein [Syntrophaceae bacterium]
MRDRGPIFPIAGHVGHGTDFSDRVLDYGTNPRNYGSLDNPDGYAKYTGPCGDTVEMFLLAADGRVTGASFRTDGCTPALASASAVTVMATGKTIRECVRIDPEAVLAHLGGLPDDSRHCALLAVRTLRRALRNLAKAGKPDRQPPHP